MFLFKVRNELEACREECHTISEKLAFAEEKVEVEKACSVEKSIEIERLKNDINQLDDQKRVTEDVSLITLNYLACLKIFVHFLRKNKYN